MSNGKELVREELQACCLLNSQVSLIILHCPSHYALRLVENHFGVRLEDVDEEGEDERKARPSLEKKFQVR
jgi:hypothetical protein